MLAHSTTLTALYCKAWNNWLASNFGEFGARYYFAKINGRQQECIVCMWWTKDQINIKSNGRQKWHICENAKINGRLHLLQYFNITLS